MRNTWLVPVGAIAATLVIAACGSSSTNNGGSGGSGGSAGSTTALSAKKVGSATLLTNSKGHTLYWFALDSSTASKCNGGCVQFWPPLVGPVTAGSGVKGTLGVITRSNGSKQATWNGHPLYTYVGDTASGTAKGNGLSLNGGVWHDIVLTGVSAPAASPSATSGGYGY